MRFAHFSQNTIYSVEQALRACSTPHNTSGERRRREQAIRMARTYSEQASSSLLMGRLSFRIHVARFISTFCCNEDNKGTRRKLTEPGNGFCSLLYYRGG